MRAVKYMGVDVLQNGNRSSGIVTGTATGLRISSVNGTAFLDNCAEFQKYTGKRIQIYDSSSRYLQGVLKEVGSGVTTNTVYTADFSAGLDGWRVSWATGYEVGSFLWDTDHTVLTVAGNAYLKSRPILARTLSMTVGALQFLEMDYSVVSGTAVITNEIVGGALSSLVNTLSGTDTYITSQQTCAGTYYNKLYLYFNGKDYDFVLNINAMRVKAITTPSSSGIIIKDLSGNQNFISKDASFTYNAASYSYKIWN